MLLSTAYLPPISYFRNLPTTDVVTIEKYEHFVKQTLRNRCHILSPNGIQTLIVPISHDHRQRAAIKDIRIANDQPWQRQHWRSMCAAYQRSAFFEFYQDDLAPFYERSYEFLMDLNMDLLSFLIEQLKLKQTFNYTSEYHHPSPELIDDFRILSDAGSADPSAMIKSYPQVFGYKAGFVPGLSIIDLLFNMGPATENYIS